MCLGGRDGRAGPGAEVPGRVPGGVRGSYRGPGGARGVSGMGPGRGCGGGGRVPPGRAGAEVGGGRLPPVLGEAQGPELPAQTPRPPLWGSAVPFLRIGAPHDGVPVGRGLRGEVPGSCSTLRVSQAGVSPGRAVPVGAGRGCKAPERPRLSPLGLPVSQAALTGPMSDAFFDFPTGFRVGATAPPAAGASPASSPGAWAS